MKNFENHSILGHIQDQPFFLRTQYRQGELEMSGVYAPEDPYLIRSGSIRGMLRYGNFHPIKPRDINHYKIADIWQLWCGHDINQYRIPNYVIQVLRDLPDDKGKLPREWWLIPEPPMQWVCTADGRKVFSSHTDDTSGQVACMNFVHMTLGRSCEKARAEGVRVERVEV